MRTSIKNIQTYYRKKDVRYLEQDVEDNNDDVEEVINKPKNKNKPLTINLPNEAPRSIKLSDDQRSNKHENKKLYLNDYYSNRKDELLEKAKLNSKLTYGIRLARELSNNKISIETVQQKTIDKWGISFDKNLNKYVSKT